MKPSAVNNAKITWKIQASKNDQKPGKDRSLTWLCNTRSLVAGAVFMHESFGSVQGFFTPVGLQLGWLEWCGARGLSMSYFTLLRRGITALTSLWLSTCRQPLPATLAFLSSLASPRSLLVLIPVLPTPFPFVHSFPLFCLCCFSERSDLNKLQGLKWIIDYGSDF